MPVSKHPLLTHLRTSAHTVLERNARRGRTPDGTAFAYTRPDNVKYPDQFYWDSCLIALAWSHLDASRARAELRTLAAAMDPSGHLGHTVFWSGPVRLARLPGYNVQRRNDRSTATIQPPLLGAAWADVADRSPDDADFRAEGLEIVRRHLGWLDRTRAEDDGLIGILQPDETGLDATPTYDRALGWRAHPYPGFVALVHANRRRGFSYRRARTEGAFTAIDVLVNTAWALSWYGLARLGDAEADARAERIVAALEARLWDDQRGMFFAEGPDRARLPVATWAGLAPLALPGLSPDIAARLIDEQLLNPGRFWLPWPVPTPAQRSQAFAPVTRAGQSAATGAGRHGRLRGGSSTGPAGARTRGDRAPVGRTRRRVDRARRHARILRPDPAWKYIRPASNAKLR